MISMMSIIVAVRPAEAMDLPNATEIARNPMSVGVLMADGIISNVRIVADRVMRKTKHIGR